MSDTKKPKPQKKDEQSDEILAEAVEPNEQDQIIEKLLTQSSEFETKYKRALADYQNLERQTAEASIRFATFAPIHPIVPWKPRSNHSCNRVPS